MLSGCSISPTHTHTHRPILPDESTYRFLKRSVMSYVTSCQNIVSSFHICFLNLIYFSARSPPHIKTRSCAHRLRELMEINACVFSADFFADDISSGLCTQCSLSCPPNGSLLWRSPQMDLMEVIKIRVSQHPRSLTPPLLPCLVCSSTLSCPPHPHAQCSRPCTPLSSSLHIHPPHASTPHLSCSPSSSSFLLLLLLPL